MIRRYFIAMTTGSLVTLGVLFVMQVLVSGPRGALDTSGTRHFVDFVRAEREEATQRKDRRREKPPEPQARPPEAVEPRVDVVNPSPVAVDVPAPPVQTELSVQGLGLVVSDGEYQPLVKVEPPYPFSARSRGIEGYCIVEYTVTAAGTVIDAVVIEADPKGIFDKVSVEAALKFKYRPRVVNGEPIAVRGVRNKFIYSLED